MTSGALGNVLARLRQPDRLNDMTDCQLLERFTAHADEAAFEELVRRHGPTVHGVCRRVLGERADVDDAFQAVFLVLVLRARSIRKGGSVSSWLYGVALRVARRARADAHRRRAAHRRLPAPAEGDAEPPAGDDPRPLLDEELGRLPDKYRAPLVLCYLQGKTHEQAARELGWPTGSMSRRLARARDLLRRRLVRRGVTLPAAALTAAVPEALARSAVRAGLATAGGAAAGGAVPAAAAALAKGAIRTMFLMKCKTALLAAVAVLGLGAAVGLLVHPGAAAPAGAPVPAGQAKQAVARPRAEQPLKGGAKGKTKGAEKSQILALAYSPDGKTVAVGFNDRSEIWDTQTWKKLSQFGEGAVALAYSPDGRRLADAPRQGENAQLHDLSNGGLVAVKGHTGKITAVAFSPDGKVLVTGSKDKTVRLWDAATAREIRLLNGSGGEIASVAFSPDGRTLATGGGDRTFLLWDVASGRILSKTQSPAAVTALAFSPDGNQIAAVSRDGSILLGNSANGEVGQKLEGHTGDVFSVAYSPDGKRLLSAGKDGKVRLWDVATGQATDLPGDHPDVRAARFSPDGNLVVFGSGATLRVWDLSRKAYVKPGGP
jgi:RNA polymerase sigma factor (sigma-70 family)